MVNYGMGEIGKETAFSEIYRLTMGPKFQALFKNGEKNRV